MATRRADSRSAGGTAAGLSSLCGTRRLRAREAAAHKSQAASRRGTAPRSPSRSRRSSLPAATVRSPGDHNPPVTTRPRRLRVVHARTHAWMLAILACQATQGRHAASESRTHARTLQHRPARRPAGTPGWSCRTGGCDRRRSARHAQTWMVLSNQRLRPSPMSMARARSPTDAGAGPSSSTCGRWGIETPS